MSDLSDPAFLHARLKTWRQWQDDLDDELAIDEAREHFGPLLQAALDVLDAPCAYFVKSTNCTCYPCCARERLRAALSRASQPGETK